MGLPIRSRGRWLDGVAAGILVFLFGWSAGWAADEPPGAVYCLTNAADSNQLAVFERNGHGALTPIGTVPTGGLGTGAGLGSQGALAFGHYGRTLYAVNAGSDNLTVFQLGGGGPQAIQLIDSRGRRPISVAVRRDLLYVLNAGGAAGDVDRISGFQIGTDGRLAPLAKSTRPLSAANTGPAQIGFSHDERVLVVTEKSTNLIDTYLVDRHGMATGPIMQASAGMTPFGFAFNRGGFLIVSEAFGGAADASAVSSYRLDSSTGLIAVVSQSVPTNQTAACWIAVARNGEVAYTTNTGSGTITGYRVSLHTGARTRVDANGITGITGDSPIDIGVVKNRFVYALTAAETDARVVGFRISHGGSLVPLGATPGLPASAIGLAAQ
jgi:6-phosphogluconolactonase (cycloisomerase 2 family)